MGISGPMRFLPNALEEQAGPLYAEDANGSRGSHAGPSSS
jgi:hypothetical protein